MVSEWVLCFSKIPFFWLIYPSTIYTITVPSLQSNWINRSFSFQNDYLSFKVHLLFFSHRHELKTKKLRTKFEKYPTTPFLGILFLYTVTYADTVLSNRWWLLKCFSCDQKRREGLGPLVNNFIHCIQLELNFVLQFERFPSRNVWLASYCTSTNKT